MAKADTRAKQIERVAEWFASRPIGNGLSPEKELLLIIANPYPKRLEAYRQLLKTFPPAVLKLYAAKIDLVTGRSDKRRPGGSREQEQLLLDFAKVAADAHRKGEHLEDRQILAKLKAMSRYRGTIQALSKKLKRARKSWAERRDKRFHRTNIDPV